MTSFGSNSPFFWDKENDVSNGDFFIYHKKRRKPEEYQDIAVEFVKENTGWKIWSTPGAPIR
jgi:hypothetical protein